MRVDVYADPVCPWCYLGKGRLERALAGRPAEWHWRPFLLNPDVPAGGIDRQLYLNARFGSSERARQIDRAVEDAAARDGIALALERIRRVPSTVDAHRLIRLAARHGRADTVMARLFAAYFSEGLEIDDHAVLAAIAANAGLDPAEVHAHLASTDDRGAVLAAAAQARRAGIQAIPCFVFNGRYALSGAHEPAAFAPLIDLAAAA